MADEWSKLRGQYQALQDDVWRDLSYRKYVVGRRKVRQAVAVLVNQWPPQGATNYQQMATDLSDMTMSVVGRQRDQQKYGVFWTLVLSWVVSEIVKLLIQRWLNSDADRESMVLMKTLREKD